MILDIDLYWNSVVSYYYGNDIQNRTKHGTTSIWDWLIEDYGATRRLNRASDNQFLVFIDDTDAVVFKLKFDKVCIESM